MKLVFDGAFAALYTIICWYLGVEKYDNILAHEIHNSLVREVPTHEIQVLGLVAWEFNVKPEPPFAPFSEEVRQFILKSTDDPPGHNATIVELDNPDWLLDVGDSLSRRFDVRYCGVNSGGMDGLVMKKQLKYNGDRAFTRRSSTEEARTPLKTTGTT